eukprot:g3515.t1
MASTLENLGENAPQGANVRGLAVNDDAAEKMERRNSRRKSGRQSFGGASPHRLSGAGSLASPRHKLKVHEQCQEAVKLVKQGKVTKTNAWCLPLQSMAKDHFEDGDGNFSKASAVLDAMSTIYGYRVDDTMLDSRKCLESLTRTKRSNIGDDMEGDDGEEGGDGEAGARGAAKKSRRTTKTVVDNPRTLMFKQPELEFDVDPFFHQMSQQFDKGGGEGMLLNNLPLANGLDLVFDGATTEGKVDQATEAKDEAAADAAEGEAVAEAEAETGPAVISVAALQLPAAGQLAGLRLCPRLAVFAQRCAELRNDADAEGEGAADAGAAPASGGGPAGTDHGDDAFGDFDDGGDDDGGYESDGAFGDDGFSSGASESCGSPGGFGGADGATAGVGGGAAPEGGAAAAATTNAVTQTMQLIDATGSTDFDFFDPKALAKIWAGQKYAGGRWKRLTAGKRKTAAGAAAGAGAEPAKRERKKAFLIDFSQSPGAGAFAQAKSAAATQLSHAVLTKHKREAADLRLPVDLHYKPRQLVQLSLNPNLRFRCCAPASAAGAAAAARGSLGGGECIGFVGGEAPPQYELEMDGEVDAGDAFDDSFDGGADDDDDGDMGGFDGSGLLEAPRLVEKVKIHYETKAKKVDVKQLKHNLWASIDTGAGTDTPAGAGAEEKPQQSFKSTISSVSKTQPASVTVPFYFICMLHLANEHGLELQGNDDLTDIAIAQ